MINEIKNKKILIKTYLSESGLWYLGKSLGDMLSKNNEVLYIPKSRYKEHGQGFFGRYYSEATDKDLLSGISYLELTNREKVEPQLLKIIAERGIDVIISFETLMRHGQWVPNLKSKTNVKIIDVPMPEWAGDRFVKNYSYNIFDEIWCLTDASHKVFEKYKNRKRVSWDYVDRSIFVPKVDKSKLDNLCFYHMGPVVSGFSQKNTLQALQAFSIFSKTINSDATLLVSGRLSDYEISIAKKCKNIILINEVLDRTEIVSLYDKSHCVIIPSSREGLGLGFYEAKAMGCDLITTNAAPMNKHSDYLCEVISYNKNESPVPFAMINTNDLVDQLIKYNEDFNMSKNEAKEIRVEKKKKTKKQVSGENNSLMAAFKENSSKANVAKDNEVDLDTLNELKEKMKNKEKDVPMKNKEKIMPEVIDTREVSIELAVIGVGQAGSRIAEVFHTKGYDVGVVNTSAQDLEFIDVAPNQKLLLEGSLGGTGKDLDLGREIFAESTSLLLPFVERVVDGNNMVYLAVSGGGGTGASSVETMVEMLFSTEMPVGVIYVLPKATEDAQSKRNSIETLSRLASMTAENMISSLVVVDNARIEQIYANLSQSKFWETSNNAIVEPLHVFNTLTAQPSRFTSLDPSDFGKIISCGDCSVYGVMEVEDYMEETSLAEAVISSLSANMLAEGFDMTQTRVGGVIITGSKEVLDKLPAININYCFHMISEQTNGASVFQGVYDVDSKSDSIKIYSWFAGLGLPRDRIDNLKQESKAQAAIASQKEKDRVSVMTLDLDEDKVNSVADQVHRKIKKKKSGFNRLQRGSRGSIIDRRRKK